MIHNFRLKGGKTDGKRVPNSWIIPEERFTVVNSRNKKERENTGDTEEWAVLVSKNFSEDCRCKVLEELIQIGILFQGGILPSLMRHNLPIFKDFF